MTIPRSSTGLHRASGQRRATWARFGSRGVRPVPWVGSRAPSFGMRRDDLQLISKTLRRRSSVSPHVARPRLEALTLFALVRHRACIAPREHGSIPVQPRPNVIETIPGRLFGPPSLFDQVRSLHVTAMKQRLEMRHLLSRSRSTDGARHARTCARSGRIRSEFGGEKLPGSRPSCRQQVGRRFANESKLPPWATLFFALRWDES